MTTVIIVSYIVEYSRGKWKQCLNREEVRFVVAVQLETHEIVKRIVEVYCRVES